MGKQESLTCVCICPIHGQPVVSFGGIYLTHTSKIGIGLGACRYLQPQLTNYATTRSAESVGKKSQ
jgi:hypothetical protein